MELNHDCVRHILLAIESDEIKGKITSDSLAELDSLTSYGRDTILYCIERLYETNYINCTTFSVFGNSDFIVSSITWSGHEFLDNIRDPKIWSNTKNTVSKIGAASLPILTEVASSLLKKSLGIQ